MGQWASRDWLKIMSIAVLEMLSSGRNYGFNGGSWSRGCLWKSLLYISARAPVWRSWLCISVAIADKYTVDQTWPGRCKDQGGTNYCAAGGFGQLPEQVFLCPAEKWGIGGNAHLFREQSLDHQGVVVRSHHEGKVDCIFFWLKN